MASKTAPDAPPAVPAAPQLCVLFVDNDVDTLEPFSLYLRTAGVAVHTAASGRGALRLARVLRPHVIILDIAMPVMDGFAVIDRLKARAETATIPVLLFTGATLGKGVERRVEFCLAKPCPPAELLLTVQRIANRA